MSWRIKDTVNGSTPALPTNAAQETGGNLASILAAITAGIAGVDPLTAALGSFLTGYDGTTDITCIGGLTPGEWYYIDSLGVEGDDDGGSGTTKVVAHVFSEAGETADASQYEILTSDDINLVAGVFADRVVGNKRTGFQAPASGNIFVKLVPTGGTVTGNCTAYLTQKA